MRAVVSAALVAGVAEECCEAYRSAFCSRRFINLARLLVGRPAVDGAWTLEYASDRLDADGHRRTLSSPIELYCVAVARRCSPRAGCRSGADLRCPG